MTPAQLQQLRASLSGLKAITQAQGSIVNGGINALGLTLRTADGIPIGTPYAAVGVALKALDDNQERIVFFMEKVLNSL